MEYRADTLEYATENDGVRYRALCIAPEPDLNWSLAKLYSREDAERQPVLASRWGELLAHFDVSNAFAPSVGAMSGEVAATCALRTPVPLPPSVCLWRNAHRKLDGVTSIQPREAFAMSAGGCAAVVVTGCGTCIVAHAGLASLVDLRNYGGDGYARERFGIMDALADTVRNLGYHPKDFRIDVLFAMPKEHYRQPFDHEQFGVQNRRLWNEYLSRFDERVASLQSSARGDELHINLAELAVAQAYDHGFGYAAAKCQLTLRHGWTRHPVPAMREQRNAVVIVRTA